MPTVFVRNEVLVHADSAAVDTLAAHISRKIRLKTTRYNLDTRVREWQIDCDWSVGTKEAYFRLLRKLKESNAQVRLSATIRLHQLKYAKQTGVPPVDRGMLMLYNMSDVAKPQTRNSILDIAVTRQYITAKTTYALPLDMALPAFAWGVVLQGAKVVGLQNNWTAKYCEKCSFLQKNKTGKYICTRDTVIGERYWRRGDAVRLEEATLADIQTLATLTTALRKADTTAVALFGWHEAMYAHYGKNDLISRWEAF